MSRTRLLLLLAVLAAPLQAQEPPRYALQLDTMVPMRDGVRLHTAVYAPEGMQGPLPIVLLRTPYSIAGAPARIGGYLGELAADGYVFAFQDLRGKYRSEGTFVMQRPPRPDRNDPRAVDETTDAWDTIEWLVHHVPANTGRLAGGTVTRGTPPANSARPCVPPPAIATTLLRPAGTHAGT